MAHRTSRSAYDRLTDRLNRYPQGAPPSDLLFRILKMLFKEKEAELVALLPIKPFNVKDAARIWKMDPKSARKVLDKLAGASPVGRFFLQWPNPVRAAAADGRFF